MGKIATLYLSDSELAELKNFCDENQCNQYPALKTALRELLSKSIERTSQTVDKNINTNTLKKENLEDEKQTKAKKPQTIRLLLNRLSAEEPEGSSMNQDPANYWPWPQLS